MSWLASILRRLFIRSSTFGRVLAAARVRELADIVDDASPPSSRRPTDPPLLESRTRSRAERSGY